MIIPNYIKVFWKWGIKGGKSGAGLQKDIKGFKSPSNAKFLFCDGNVEAITLVRHGLTVVPTLDGCFNS